MTYRELTGNGTFVLKTSAGYLQGFQINNNPAGPATIRVFDQTSAAAPAIAGGAAAFALNSTAGSFLDYDCHFTNGLTIVIASSAAGFSITAEYA